MEELLLSHKLMLKGDLQEITEPIQISLENLSSIKLTKNSVIFTRVIPDINHFSVGTKVSYTEPIQEEYWFSEGQVFKIKDDLEA